MPSYKLMYFNNRGKAEPIRLAFHFAGVDFIDHRFEDGEWSKIKDTTPQGKCPVLETEGEIIPQSVAIMNYVARKFDLYGEGIMENTKVDVAVATADEIFSALNNLFEEFDEQKKKEMKDELRKNDLPRFCKIFCTMLEKSPSEWLVGSKITIADLAVYNAFEFFQAMVDKDQNVEDDLLKDREKLLTHRRKIREIPAINKYLSSRPVTPM